MALEPHAWMFAGLLGISGASIVNPLLLEFGVHPQAAAATSTLMVLFTSSSAALSFGFGHQLNLQFALVFGLCCMGASLVGVVLVQRIVKRSGKVCGPDGILTAKPCAWCKTHTCCMLGMLIKCTVNACLCLRFLHTYRHHVCLQCKFCSAQSTLHFANIKSCLSTCADHGTLTWGKS